MQVEIITPEVTFFSGTAYLVQLPGVDGSFELMDHHVPLITVLKQGKIKVLEHMDAEPLFIEILSGAVEMKDNKVNILAEVR